MGPSDLGEDGCEGVGDWVDGAWLVGGVGAVRFEFSGGEDGSHPVLVEIPRSYMLIAIRQVRAVSRRWWRVRRWRDPPVYVSQAASARLASSKGGGGPWQSGPDMVDGPP